MSPFASSFCFPRGCGQGLESVEAAQARGQSPVRKQMPRFESQLGQVHCSNAQPVLAVGLSVPSSLSPLVSTWQVDTGDGGWQRLLGTPRRALRLTVWCEGKASMLGGQYP